MNFHVLSNLVYFFPFICCFMKQIIGSPIIMYLSLKKTFSLLCGVQVRADLLCIKKLVQGVLVTLLPPSQDSWRLRKCTVFQSSFLVCKFQGFHTGYKMHLEPFHSQGSWVSCLGMKINSGGGHHSGCLSCFFLLSHTQLDPPMDDSDVHISSLRSVCFSPEGLYLATVADDR